MDAVFQVTAARMRLYWMLRNCGDTPDRANLHLLSIIQWWSKRAPVGWLLIAVLGYLIKSQSEAHPLIMWWSTVVFTLALLMATASALRLMTLAQDEQLRSYLQQARSSEDMIDGPIR